MGNHEFCELCYASSFHHNMECDPKARAIVVERERLIEIRAANAKRLVANLITKLRAMGIPAELDSREYYTGISISGWDLVDGEKP